MGYGFSNHRPFILESNIAKFNTICSGEQTTCTISKDFLHGSGAYTNMEDFSVHLPLLEDEYNFVDAKSIWGVNLHELAHIMFSPTVNVHVRLDIEYGKVYTFAEENRVENLYHIMAPGNKELMSHGVRKATGFDNITDEMKGMSDDAKVWNYYLNCLRPWNSNGWLKSLRSDVSTIIGKNNVDRIDELVLQYSMLPKVDIVHQAPQILDELKSILPSSEHESPDHVCQGGEYGSGSHNFDDSSVTQEFKSLMGQGEGQNSGSGDSSDGDQDSQVSDSGDGDSDNDEGQGSGSGKESDSDQNGEGQGGNEAEEGTIASQIGDKDEEGTSPIRSEHDLNKDSKGATREMSGTGGMAGRGYGGLKTYPKAISIKEKSDMKVFKRKLEELEESLDPGYINNLPSGSIYINEAMKPNRDINKMFRRWDGGVNDELGIEAVILIDNSGSMAQNDLEQCSANAWSFTKALEALGDSSVTIMSFNNGHDYLYTDISQMGTTQVNVAVSGGGTDPYSALDAAYGIFSRSDLDRKMMLVFTDGEWGGYGNEEMVRKIGKMGVSTGMMYFDNGWGSHSHSVAKEFQYNIKTNEMGDLAKMGKTIVRNLLNM